MKNTLHHQLEELKNKLLQKEKNETSLLNEMEHLSNRIYEAEKEKSHFLSNILNEINNPLASILGLSQSIMRMAYDDPENIRRQALLIYEEAFNLDCQLRNVFAAAEIEGGIVTVKPNKVNIRQLVDNLVAEMQVKTRRKNQNIWVNVDAEETLVTDPHMVMIILMNLLNNAIEYSPERKNILVAGQVNNGVAVISVEDFGQGISEEEKDVIFQRFRQLDTGTTKKHRGQGLGLSVVKEFLELINGKLDIESKVGTGSKFTITINSLPVDISGVGAMEVDSGTDEIF